MHIEIETLERATLDAVAPSEVETAPGWLIPLDRSTVGRATSAVPLQHHVESIDALPWIESRYIKRGLSPQFRIADVKGLEMVQEALHTRGYGAQAATLTMVGNKTRMQATPTSWQVQLSTVATPAWAAAYLATDFDPADGANRVKAFSRSNCIVYAWIEEDGATLAAATASISRGWVGLHGLRTLTYTQGKGCCTALVQALLHHAATHQIDKYFLQVDEDNAPAISLYHRLGFQTAWRYHYWRKPD